VQIYFLCSFRARPKIGALHEKSEKSNEKKRASGLSVQVPILHEKSVLVRSNWICMDAAQKVGWYLKGMLLMFRGLVLISKNEDDPLFRIVFENTQKEPSIVVDKHGALYRYPIRCSLHPPPFLL
jgi:hypothetical protein